MQKAQSSLEASNELKHAADGLQSTLAATQLALDHCRRELSDKEVLLEEAQNGNQIKVSLEQALESLR